MIAIADMEDDHLYNAIMLMERRPRWRSDRIYVALVTEAYMRGIDLP